MESVGAEYCEMLSCDWETLSEEGKAELRLGGVWDIYKAGMSLRALNELWINSYGLLRCVQLLDALVILSFVLVHVPCLAIMGTLPRSHVHVRVHTPILYSSSKQ